MKKIPSFTVDHIRLLRGIYVSRKDTVGNEIVTTFDIRMTRPNFEPVMNTAEMHTIEHLAATFLRNHPVYGSKTVYFGPMGCRTGFYLLTRDTMTHADALALVQDALAFIRSFEGPVPGAQHSRECGNYLDHDLPAARAYAADYAKVLEGWSVDAMHYAS